MTDDPFTGARGPRLLPAFDNVDHAEAVASLVIMQNTGAAMVLPGHGEPWTQGIAEAVGLARSPSPVSRY